MIQFSAGGAQFYAGKVGLVFAVWFGGRFVGVSLGKSLSLFSSTLLCLYLVSLRRAPLFHSRSLPLVLKF
jgi:hypothetical protein